MPTDFLFFIKYIYFYIFLFYVLRVDILQSRIFHTNAFSHLLKLGVKWTRNEWCQWTWGTGNYAITVGLKRRRNPGDEERAGLLLCWSLDCLIISICCCNPHLQRVKGLCFSQSAMETSLRYDNRDKHLLLHAKENFLLEKSFFLQVHTRNYLTAHPSDHVSGFVLIVAARYEFLWYWI